jgi:hypothetical protein
MVPLVRLVPLMGLVRMMPLVGPPNRGVSPHRNIEC